MHDIHFELSLNMYRSNVSNIVQCLPMNLWKCCSHISNVAFEFVFFILPSDLFPFAM